MASVTNRIKEITQPRGGYLPIRSFRIAQLQDEQTLAENENISPALIGLVVDYLSRFMQGATATEAFSISLKGAKIINELDTANDLICDIRGLDDLSVISACKLVGFDVCYRLSPTKYKSIDTIDPDEDTIGNIRIMVKRSINFLAKCGEIVKSNITFEGGYTSIIHAGDGDFMTHDTLWDFKVSKSKPTSKHSLQLLVYYIMGLHSIHKEFKEVNHLGFFNPRLNTVYLCDVNDIPAETIDIVSKTVIGYGTEAENIFVESSSNTDAILNFAREINSRTEMRPNKSISYSVAEVSTYLKVQKKSVYQDIHNGVLIASKKGNKYVVSQEAFEKYKTTLQKRKYNLLLAASISVAVTLALFLFLISLI